MKKDYYLILRLKPDATAEEIRSAYRRLAIELHPDISGFGSDPFLELQEAYSVLSDPVRRAVYDREAEGIPIRRAEAARPAEIVIRRRHSAEPPPTPLRSMGGSETISLLQSFETFLPSLSDMFDRLWNNFELVTLSKAERLESLTVDVPLSLRQAFTGGQIRILVPARVICPSCRGRGHVGPYRCSRCDGDGTLRSEYPITISYPPGLQQDYIVRLPLGDFGSENFYLSVQFRPPQVPIW
jgi:molecular chaperone DnaJ